MPENLTRDHASPESFPILERTGMLELERARAGAPAMEGTD